MYLTWAPSKRNYASFACFSYIVTFKFQLIIKTTKCSITHNVHVYEQQNVQGNIFMLVLFPVAQVKLKSGITYTVWFIKDGSLTLGLNDSNPFKNMQNSRNLLSVRLMQIIQHLIDFCHELSNKLLEEFDFFWVQMVRI